MTDTRTRDAIGVALMVQAGLPRLEAEVAMATDPECQQIADQLVPILERLVARLDPALTAGGRS